LSLSEYFSFLPFLHRIGFEFDIWGDGNCVDKSILSAIINSPDFFEMFFPKFSYFRKKKRKSFSNFKSDQELIRKGVIIPEQLSTKDRLNISVNLDKAAETTEIVLPTSIGGKIDNITTTNNNIDNVIDNNDNANNSLGVESSTILEDVYGNENSYLLFHNNIFKLYDKMIRSYGLFFHHSDWMLSNLDIRKNKKSFYIYSNRFINSRFKFQNTYFYTFVNKQSLVPVFIYLFVYFFLFMLFLGE
jgi:hypothetical protein